MTLLRYIVITLSRYNDKKRCPDWDIFFLSTQVCVAYLLVILILKNERYTK